MKTTGFFRQKTAFSFIKTPAAAFPKTLFLPFLTRKAARFITAVLTHDGKICEKGLFFAEKTAIM